jgi:hypothetical protein
MNVDDLLHQNCVRAKFERRLTSVAIIAVVNGLGTKLNTTFASVSSQLN